ncbi:MAG: hypothetical protein ABJG88_05310 [Litorimonas sp.]
MRLLLTLAIIIWPSFAFAQLGSHAADTDELVSNSRLGKLAKKLSDENSSTTNPLPIQGQTLGQSSLQNNRVSSPITNVTPSLSSESITSGTYDLSAGQDRSLDIAGVMIGMSPDQVKQILAIKGYNLEETENGPSFEELVKIEREDINVHDASSFKGSIQMLEFRKLFETIRINFMSMPKHPIVSRVSYANKDTALTPDKMRHLLMDKYGADEYRTFKLKQMVGTSGVLRVRDQQKLDNQRNFDWFNRDGLKTRRTQTVVATIESTYSTADVRLSLALEGEPDLEILQDEHIRSRFGTTSTTF